MLFLKKNKCLCEWLESEFSFLSNELPFTFQREHTTRMKDKKEYHSFCFLGEEQNAYSIMQGVWGSDIKSAEREEIRG